MRKWIGITVVAVLLVTLGSISAGAQTAIALGPSASGSIAFVGSGGTVNIDLGTCSGGTCTLQGQSALFPSGPDSYSLTSTGPITLDSSGTITQANPILFSYNNGSGGTLTGYLQLVNFAQAGPIGVFNYTLTANLTGLGGTLASSFSGSAIVTLFSTSGAILTGAIIPAIIPTPEASTMTLFGVGLLGLLGLSLFLQRRLVTVSSTSQGDLVAI